jgi:DNA polymerase III alpha subunit
MSAKQAGLNIGVLSALIQAGLLDSFVAKNRCRLVLEAQTFNILTDREKRNFIELGDAYDYDILSSIFDAVKNDMVGDDNRKIMTPKRFQTFQKKYQPYRKIFDMNNRHIKYANWFFEEKLLGYSYSHTIRDVHAHEQDFQSALSIKRSEERRSVRFVGFVTDVLKRTSKNGNKYARFQIQDESGLVNALFLDSNSNSKFTDFLNSGKKLPKKGDITIIEGVTGDDVVFVNKINPISDKIYMKLSEVK